MSQWWFATKYVGFVTKQGVLGYPGHGHREKIVDYYIAFHLYHDLIRGFTTCRLGWFEYLWEKIIPLWFDLRLPTTGVFLGIFWLIGLAVTPELDVDE